jgi:LacI family transcriptional regulator
VTQVSKNLKARPTLATVAAEAGVSVGLVSRLLNNDPDLKISDETRQRVLAAVDRVDYVPNHAGRALRLQRTNTIAMIVPDISSSIYTELIDGAARAAQELGALLVLARSEIAEKENEFVRKLVDEGHVDGIIFQRQDFDSPSWLRSIRTDRVRAVLLNSSDRGPWGSVTIDEEAAAAVAVQALVDAGHSDIAIICGLKVHENSRRRYRGFARALRNLEIGLPRDFVVWSGLHAEDGHAGMRALLAARRRPTGVFVAGSGSGIGALREALAHGVDVPGDMAMIAMHDAWPAQDMTPALATVRTPLEHMGDQAIRLVLDMLNGEPKRHIVIDDPAPVVIPRETI